MKTDKEILDWLSEHSADIQIHPDGVSVFTIPSQHTEGKDLRHLLSDIVTKYQDGSYKNLEIAENERFSRWLHREMPDVVAFCRKRYKETLDELRQNVLNDINKAHGVLP